MNLPKRAGNDKPLREGEGDVKVLHCHEQPESRCARTNRFAWGELLRERAALASAM